VRVLGRKRLLKLILVPQAVTVFINAVEHQKDLVFCHLHLQIFPQSQIQVIAIDSSFADLAMGKQLVGIECVKVRPRSQILSVCV
jgi:hypothetical protein